MVWYRLVFRIRVGLRVRLVFRVKLGLELGIRVRVSSLNSQVGLRMVDGTVCDCSSIAWAHCYFQFSKLKMAVHLWPCVYFYFQFSELLFSVRRTENNSSPNSN